MRRLVLLLRIGILKIKLPSLLFVALVTLFSNFSSNVYAQGQANVWYFGNGLGFDFNQTPVKALSDGWTSSGYSGFAEATSSICDKAGNILFYTDGYYVYRGNGTRLTTIKSHGDFSQNLIVPNLAVPNQYFVIYPLSANPTGALTPNASVGYGYTIISATSGTDAALVGAPDRVFYNAGTPQCLTAIANATNTSYWIVAHERGSSNYLVWDVANMAAAPKKFPVGKSISASSEIGLLKVNSCSNQIAFTDRESVEVVGFNNSTGTVSNLLYNITNLEGKNAYGLEFSPRGRFLYVTLLNDGAGGVAINRIYQFDLSLGAAAINSAAARSTIESTGPAANPSQIGHLQLGPDGRIYIATLSSWDANAGYVSVIATPDGGVGAAAIGYQRTAYTWPAGLNNWGKAGGNYSPYASGNLGVGRGLPPVLRDFVSSIATIKIGTDDLAVAEVCQGQSLPLSITVKGGLSTNPLLQTKWEITDPTLKTFTGNTIPPYKFDNVGKIPLKVTVYDLCDNPKYINDAVNVIPFRAPTVSLPSPRCPNKDIIVSGTGAGAANYKWYDTNGTTVLKASGSTYTYNGTLPKTIWVEDVSALAAGNSAGTLAQNWAGGQTSTAFTISKNVVLTSADLQWLTYGTPLNVTVSIRTGSPTGTIVGSPVTVADVSKVATAVFNTNLSIGTYYLVVSSTGAVFSNGGAYSADPVLTVTDGGPFKNIKYNVPYPCSNKTQVVITELNCCTKPANTVSIDQPSPFNVCIPGTKDMTASIGGTLTGLQYQWVKDGNLIGTAATATAKVTLAGLGGSLTDGGDYSVRLFPTGTPTCFTESAKVTVGLNNKVAITTQPTTVSPICPGTTANFSVVATGSGSLTYQWKKNNVNVTSGTGGNTSAFSLGNVTSLDAGSYIVEVSNVCGMLASSAVPLVIDRATAVSAQVMDATKCEGEKLDLSVTATGTNLTYLWQKGTPLTTIASATTSTYSVASSGLTGGGPYSVTVKGKCGDVTRTGTVTINEKVKITLQPLGNTICQGANHTFAASAKGAGLKYQWQKGGVDIVGATSSTLAITAAKASDAGSYTLKATGTCAPVVTSNVAVLVVNSAVVLTGTTPTDVTVCEEQSVTFQQTVAGTGITYQWQKGGVDITGKTANSITFNPATLSDAGTYTLNIKSGCGNQSIVVKLVVDEKVRVTLDPSPLTKCENEPATFSAKATGKDVGIQWQLGGKNIIGATSETYTISSVKKSDGVIVGNEGNYSVLFTGKCNTISSSTALLTVNPVTKIVTQPLGVTVCATAKVDFIVSATGLNLKYQWRKEGTNISGATNAIFTIPSVSTSDAGNYTVVVSGDCGNLTSTVAPLVISSGTAITLNPVDVKVCQNGTAVFKGSGAGAGTVLYEWFKDGASLGKTGDELTIANVTVANVGNYNFVAKSGCGDSPSNPAKLILKDPTVITVAPVGTTLCEGKDYTLTTLGTGDGIISYQWYNLQGMIVGQQSTSLSLKAIKTSDIYKVDVIGGCGTVTSADVNVIVEPTTLVTVQPVDKSICINQAFTLDVTASNATEYTWKKVGGSQVGTNASTFTITNATKADEGTYTVDVKGNCNTVISNVVKVTVNELPVMLDATDDMCTGKSFDFTPSFTPSVSSFSWNRATTVGIDEAGSSGSSNISEILNNSSPNPITVVYTVKGTTAEGCVGQEAKVSLRIDPLPVAPTGWGLFPDPVCQSAKGQKYSTLDGAGLEWTVSPISSAKIVSGKEGTIVEIDFEDDATVPVTINVVAKNNCGFSSNGLTRPVTVNPLPNKPDLIKGDPEVCPGTSGEKYFVQTPEVGATYIWSFLGTATGKTIIPGSSSDNITINYDKADVSTATLQVVTVATNGCGESLPTEQLLSILDIPTATSSGGAATCVTNPLPNVDFFFTGTQPFSFSYTNGVTTISDLTDNPNFTALSGTVAGNYQVLTIKDGNGCEGLPSNITTVSVIPLPDKTLNVISKDVCFGSPTSITIEKTEVSASYDAIIKGLKVQTLQGTGGDIVFTIPANRLNPGTENKIDIIARGNDIQTCESVRLTNFAKVTAVGKLDNQPQSPVCDVDLNNQTVVLQPSIGADSYSWNYPVGVTEISSPSNISKVLRFSATAVATAPIIVTVTPKLGALSCPQLSGDLSFTFKDSYMNTAKLLPGIDTLCALGKLEYKIENTDKKSGVTFNKWTIPVGANVVEYLYEPNPDPRIKNVTGAIIEFGQYGGIVSVEPYAECQVRPIVKLDNQIEIIPTPIANAGNDTTVYTVLDPINLDGTGSKVKNPFSTGPDSVFLSSSNEVYLNGSPKYTYKWETSDNEPIPFSDKLVTIATPKEWEVTYTLNVKSTNKKSCSAKDEKKVIVDILIKVPNIFSPNGDGLHDYFEIENIQFFKDGLVEIYNQWGDLIYKTRDYNNHKWDGKHNGVDMPLATYYYLIYPNVNKYKPISGSITLVR